MKNEIIKGYCLIPRGGYLRSTISLYDSMGSKLMFFYKTIELAEEARRDMKFGEAVGLEVMPIKLVIDK